MDMKALASIDSQHIHNIEEVNEEFEGQSRRSNKKIEALQINKIDENQDQVEQLPIIEKVDKTVKEPQVEEIKEKEPSHSKWKLPEDDVYLENNDNKAELNHENLDKVEQEVCYEGEELIVQEDPRKSVDISPVKDITQDYEQINDIDAVDKFLIDNINIKQFEEPIAYKNVEFDKRLTEDLSNFVQKIAPNNLAEIKNKNLSIKSEVIKGPVLSTSEAETKIENMPGPISLFSLNCEIHQNEYIKYFCREEDCKYGLCQSCLYEHINHDYIYADEIASFEIKQALKATMTECAYKIKSQSMLHNETEKLAKFIDDLKLQEYEKIHYYFMDLHKELDRREKQLKDIYYEEVKDVEGILK